MSTDFEIERFERSVWESAEALARKRAELERVQGELEELRDATAVALRRYGAALSIDESAVPRSTVRRLYWEYRDIPAKAIAAAFSLPGGPSQVYLHAGEDHFDIDCPNGCGRKVRLTARTAKVKPCEDCQHSEQQRRAKQNAEWSVANEARRRDRDAWLRDQLLSGRTPEDLYVEYASKYETNGPLEEWRRVAAELEKDGGPPLGNDF